LANKPTLEAIVKLLQRVIGKREYFCVRDLQDAKPELFAWPVESSSTTTLDIDHLMHTLCEQPFAEQEGFTLTPMAVSSKRKQQVMLQRAPIDCPLGVCVPSKEALMLAAMRLLRKVHLHALRKSEDLFKERILSLVGEVLKGVADEL
jgi:hypothetical protein